MRKKHFVCLLISALLSTASLVHPQQQPTKTPRIGYLIGQSLSTGSGRIEALRQGLRELGYVEGKNIVIELRFAEENPDRFPALVA